MNKIFFVIAILLLPMLGVAQNVGLNIGDKAPEISAKTPDDQVLKLSSLKRQTCADRFLGIVVRTLSERKPQRCGCLQCLPRQKI